jgi:pheromone shutdown-related protein TraB
MSEEGSPETTTPSLDSEKNSAHKDIHRIQVGQREFIIVGTAHISKSSADLVHQTIVDEKPDRVCVELDDRRYQSLSQKTRFENLDLRQIIRRKQLSALITQIALSSYQKKLGGQLGVMPGTELLEATRSAQDQGIPFDLCDRDVQITLKRAWRSTPFTKKFLLVAAIVGAVFEKTEIDEKKLEEIKHQDVLSEMMNELGKELPTLKRVLIDERDQYLATRIIESKGDRIVAIVGAGHVPGILKHLKNQPEKEEQGDSGERPKADLKPLEIIPPTSPWMKIIGWSIPTLIICALAWILVTKGSQAASENLVFWILANGIPCSIGAALALAHPLTILIGFLAAPLTSLTPVIGAGYVTAFAQAYLQPPLVREFQSVAEDMVVLKLWWKNRLLKIFLVFILPGLGSMVGTYVGGWEIFKNLF